MTDKHLIVFFFIESTHKVNPTPDATPSFLVSYLWHLHNQGGRENAKGILLFGKNTNKQKTQIFVC